jgi:hypothetical protein
MNDRYRHYKRSRHGVKTRGKRLPGTFIARPVLWLRVAPHRIEPTYVEHFDEIDRQRAGAVTFDDVKRFLRTRGTQLD